MPGSPGLDSVDGLRGAQGDKGDTGDAGGEGEQGVQGEIITSYLYQLILKIPLVLMALAIYRESSSINLHVAVWSTV